jgi:DNA adenine methylase
MESNHKYISPLRYPGGKSKIASFIEDILLLNNLEGCTLYELYAGGAGASLNILFSGLCKKLVLNDLDYHIYAFWYSILNHTDEFLRLIYDTEINISNWDIQKEIYDKYYEYDLIEIGFSTFFLNRCNRSGILYKAGPIGGRNQTGNYNIDVRFNKTDLIKRIEQIASFRDKVEIHNLESLEMIDNIFRNNLVESFLFLDPPYYIQGERLYMSCYDDSDHVALSEKLSSNSMKNWFLTYDNCDRINELYNALRRSELSMSYTLQSKRKAKEVMVFSDSLYLPKQLSVGSKSSALSLINE